MVTKITFYESADVFIIDKDRIFADPSHPPLQHNFNETIILFVRRRRRLCQRQRCNDGLWVVEDNGFIELLEFQVRSRNIAIFGASEITQIGLLEASWIGFVISCFINLLVRQI